MWGGLPLIEHFSPHILVEEGSEDSKKEDKLTNVLSKVSIQVMFKILFDKVPLEFLDQWGEKFLYGDKENIKNIPSLKEFGSTFVDNMLSVYKYVNVNNLKVLDMYRGSNDCNMCVLEGGIEKKIKLEVKNIYGAKQNEDFFYDIGQFAQSVEKEKVKGVFIISHLSLSHKEDYFELEPKEIINALSLKYHNLVKEGRCSVVVLKK